MSLYFFILILYCHFDYFMTISNLEKFDGQDSFKSYEVLKFL